MHPQRLGSTVLKALAERNDINTAEVDDVIWATSNQRGLQSGDLGRMSALDAGYDVKASGITMDRFCGSGISSVNFAASMVMSGMEDCVVAGGAEMMSRFADPENGKGGAPTMDNGNLHLRKLHPQTHQGVCADAIASMEGIPREDLDALGLESQKRADNAIKNGHFDQALVPVYNDDGSLALDKEEFPRPQTTAEDLAGLKPSFAPMMDVDLDGEGLTLRSLVLQKYPDLDIVNVHHAGNSSGVVDGAAAVLMASPDYAKKQGWKPRARVVAMANMGDCPTLMLNAPVPAAKKVLEKAGLTLDDIDLFEVNEAFAVVAEKFIRDLKLDRDKVNVNGGAMALGHPIGATGSMLIGTMVDELERRDLKRGLITMCAGGGQVKFDRFFFQNLQRLLTASCFNNFMPGFLYGERGYLSAMHQKTEFAEALLESATDAIIATDLNGKISYWNKGAGFVFGYDRSEVIGLKVTQFFGAGCTLPGKISQGKTRADGASQYETQVPRKNGEVIDVSLSLATINDGKGRPIGYSIVAQDISDRSSSSQYARSLIEASLDPLVTISPDGKITDVNEATIAVTGVARDDLIGTDFSNYFTEPELAREGYQRVFDEGFVTDYALTVRHKSGKLTDVLYNASVYRDAQGEVLGVFAAARDVTEQKQSSQYARSLIEASLDPLVTISPDGKITDVNEATITITGVARDNLIGTDFSNYFTEPELAREGYRRVFDEGFVTDYALTVRHRSGKLTDVLYNASVYRDVQGEVLGVFAAARDVTEQKQSSQYARSLIEASVDPLVTINPDGKVTDVNEATIAATGVPRDKLIGTDFSDYFTEPDKAREGYQQVFEQGVVTDYPLTIRHVSGRLIDVLYNASVYRDTRERVLGVFAAARDITEQKQSSQYARSLIEASVDPLVTISPDGKITDVNEATIEATGVSREELIGTDFSIYFTEPVRAQAGYQQVFDEGVVTDYPLTIRHKSGSLREVLYNASVYNDAKGEVLGVFAAARDITAQRRAEQEAAEKEKRLVRLSELERFQKRKAMGELAPGTQFTSTDVQRAMLNILEDLGDEKYLMECSQKAMLNILQDVSDDKVLMEQSQRAMLNVLEDYGDEKQAVEEINTKLSEAKEELELRVEERTKELQQSNSELESFSYSVSHDLRAPLRAIVGYSSLLVRNYSDQLDDEGIRILQVLVKNAKQMGNLIDDVLELSRLGRRELKDDAIDLTSMFRRVAEEITDGPYSNADISIAPLTPCRGDRTMLLQLVTNLLSNAAKYSSTRDRPQIWVDQLGEKNPIYFVKDNGVGFNDKYMDKIFGVFERLHTSDEFEGTGVGMAIAERVMKSHGGRIWAEGEEGKGATFYFTFNKAKGMIDE
ncbi:fadA [Symbiodinium microadriaticum]|nr:fadA [Symbiodinium microadriaticum]